MGATIVGAVIGIVAVLIGVGIQHYLQQRMEGKKLKIEILSELIGELNQLKEVAKEKDIFVFQIELDRNAVLKDIIKVKSEHTESWFDNMQRLDERLFSTRPQIFKLLSKLKASYGSDQKELYQDIRDHMLIDSLSPSVFDDVDNEDLRHLYLATVETKKETMKNKSAKYYQSINSILGRLNGLLSSHLN